MKNPYKNQMMLSIRLLVLWSLFTGFCFICYRITAIPITIGGLLLGATISISLLLITLLYIHMYMDYKKEKEEQY